MIEFSLSAPEVERGLKRWIWIFVMLSTLNLIFAVFMGGMLNAVAVVMCTVNIVQHGDRLRSVHDYLAGIEKTVRARLAAREMEGVVIQ